MWRCAGASRFRVASLPHPLLRSLYLKPAWDSVTVTDGDQWLHGRSPQPLLECKDMDEGGQSGNGGALLTLTHIACNPAATHPAHCAHSHPLSVMCIALYPSPLLADCASQYAHLR